MSKVIPVILCGGSGSRLYPLSTPKRPKFLWRFGGTSLLQQTLARMPHQRAIIALNEALLERVKAHLCEGAEQVNNPTNPKGLFYLVEPHKRNTAPALVAAAVYVAKTYGPEAVLFASPADHLVSNSEGFAHATKLAIAKARKGGLVTLGVPPTHPSSQLGYIRINNQRVKGFVEKPTKPQAEQMLRSGGYLWNAGVYCFTAATLLAEAKLHCSNILRHCQEAVEKGKGGGGKETLGKGVRGKGVSGKQTGGEADCLRLNGMAFGRTPNISVDYAISQKSKRLVCVATEMDWIDIGNWRSLVKARLRHLF